MTLDELNKIQTEIEAGYIEALNNIQGYFGNNSKYFEIKKDAVKSALEIFKTSLRLIEEERGKFNR